MEDSYRGIAHDERAFDFGFHKLESRLPEVCCNRIYSRITTDDKFSGRECFDYIGMVISPNGVKIRAGKSGAHCRVGLVESSFVRGCILRKGEARQGDEPEHGKKVRNPASHGWEL